MLSVDRIKNLYYCVVIIILLYYTDTITTINTTTTTTGAYYIINPEYDHVNMKEISASGSYDEENINLGLTGKCECYQWTE